MASLGLKCKKICRCHLLDPCTLTRNITSFPADPRYRLPTNRENDKKKGFPIWDNTENLEILPKHRDSCKLKLQIP